MEECSQSYSLELERTRNRWIKNDWPEIAADFRMFTALALVSGIRVAGNSLSGRTRSAESQRTQFVGGRLKSAARCNEPKVRRVQ